MTEQRTPYISLKNITKVFGGNAALKDVSVEVYPGEVFCLLGDNGAGKSTLIKVLSGFHQPTSGIIQVEDRELGSRVRAMPPTWGSLRYTSSVGLSRL